MVGALRASYAAGIEHGSTMACGPLLTAHGGSHSTIVQVSQRAWEYVIPFVYPCHTRSSLFTWQLDIG